MATTPPKLPIAVETDIASAVAATQAVAPVIAAVTSTAVATTTTFPVSGSGSTATVTVPNKSGTVTFQLVVTDNLGQQSAPATVTVTIQGAPVANITATPNPVKAGAPITLSGAGSTAVSPGTLTNFTFSLVTPVGT